MTAVLTIWRPGRDGPETLLELDAQGDATGFNGHVDLGTGLRTSLCQIVAEELDLPLSRVRMVMGDTARTPDQGPTIASESIQVAAVPLRQAAAQARGLLIALARDRLGTREATIDIREGVLFCGPDAIPFAKLLENRQLRVELDPATAVKPVAAYRIVGTSSPRVDIAGKVTGDWDFVHDLRLPGMLHGHVIRPPYAGRDSGAFIGHSLIEVDDRAIRDLPGFVAVVRIRDFLAVVAEREGQARAMAEALHVRWACPPDLPDLGDVAAAIRALPATRRLLSEKGDVDAALARASVKLARSYVWPWQMHGSIGPSCAVADWRGDRLVVWSGTQNPHALRADIAQLVGLPEPAIEVLRLEAAGCFGRNCADDVCGDAALLARAVGRPVRVQLTREQEHLWEPKGAGQLMDVAGGLDDAGNFDVYDFEARYPSNRAPNLALLLTGMIDNAPLPSDMGDRTAVPQYDVPNLRAAVHDMAPVVRASWLRGVSAMPNAFAHESFVDELAHAAGEDPVAFRLRHLSDPRARDLIRRVAEESGWVTRTGPRQNGPHQTGPHQTGPHQTWQGDWSFGQGFAWATYMHGPFPGVAAAQAAWMAEVAVNRTTGEVALTRLTVGQDAGLMINPDGVRHQIHGNVVQSISRTLTESVDFDRIGVTSRDWGAYPLARFEDLPEVRTLLMERPEDPPLGVGESASIPSAAAIANAIFDATGVRMRELPFTPDRVLAALNAGSPSALAAPPPRSGWQKGWRRWTGSLAAAALGGLVMGTVGLSWRSEIARVPPPAGLWSAQTLERGRQLFAAGNCATCHTVEGETPLTGGRAFKTPFGTVYSTNLTPDPDTGLGAWSFAAFSRAMREGVSRDGRHLYPAFPYTSFARIGEDDMQALYAYIQSLDPRPAQTPQARMIAPVNLRALMAPWNALFHKATTFQPDPAQSPEWNRGAYLVEGVGHCSACHSPRNRLGAERAGAAHLAGAMVDGWYAPPLNGQGPAPLGWSTDDFYAYLRHGHAPRHGVAAGPMAPVVAGLAALDDADIQAMAVYLSARNRAPNRAEPEASALVRQADAALQSANGRFAQMFNAACGACHTEGPVGLVNAAQVPLVLGSAVHAPSPDNLVNAVIRGISAPNGTTMPPFGPVLTDADIAGIADFLRATLAPDKPAWTDLDRVVARIRATR